MQFTQRNRTDRQLIRIRSDTQLNYNDAFNSNIMCHYITTQVLPLGYQRGYLSNMAKVYNLILESIRWPVESLRGSFMQQFPILRTIGDEAGA